jgi:uncharacterized protein YndB with AHSA1/START domain
MVERRSESAVATEDREIVVTRVVNAPRELVWNAWTDPKQVVKWWGPKGFTTTIHEMEVKPGGVWRHTMHGPDGTDYPNYSVFIEVVKPERIVYSHGGHKEDGPSARFESTWTFEALGDQTRITMRGVFPSAAERDRVVKEFHAIEGGKQTLSKLEEYVMRASRKPGEGPNAMQREIVIERVFDAPWERVFNAWIDPKHLSRWFGPKIFTIPVCETDARVGGAWHIVMRSRDGQEFPCGGVYHEIVVPERLVFTNNAVDHEGYPVINGLTTVVFAELDGKTKLTLRTRGTAMVDYAAAYLKGMEAGWTQSLEKLAEELAKL